MLCQEIHCVTKLPATSEGALRTPSSAAAWFIWLQDFSVGVKEGSIPCGREKEEEMYLPSSFLSAISCW